MTRRILITVLSALPVLHAADALPTAEAILERYIEVTGGKQAYAKRKSEIVTGTLEFASLGIKGKMQRYSDDPDKYYMTVDLAGIGAIETGVADGIAWEKNPIQGPRIKSGDEKAQALREASLNASLNWRKHFPKVEVAGLETVDGDECYKVVMTPPDGHAQTMYFSKKSGLAMKTTMVAASQMGEVPVAVTVTDYKNFDGVWVPSKTIQKAVGQEFTMTIESVQMNPEIPADRFALPAEVKALAAKAASK
jgi:hypothetical protein